jgi:hypothetical protein
MTTIETEELNLLAATVREVLAGPGDAVDARLAELGWDEVVAADPGAATQVLFTEHGRALAGTALLDRVDLAALDVTADAVCYPSSGTAPTSGPAGIRGLLLRLPAPSETVVVPLAGGNLAVVPASGLAITPLRTFDSSLTWYAVSGDAASESTPGSWEDAVAAAHRALAAELVGVSGEVLRLAVEHTSTRTQFGAPIAAFQAVRHRLADAHVAIAAARSLLAEAFVAGTHDCATAAKAQAGRAHELATAHALQVTGAMGSSIEHPLHTFVNRGVVLDALLGGWGELVGALGHQVVTTGTTPLLIEV